MNQRDIINKLIKNLEHVLKRPTMYLGTVTWDAANIFIYGFSCAYGAMGVPLTLDIRRQATNSRGWEFTSIRGADKMREQGLSEEQIVQELLLIEIKMLELVAGGLEA